MKTMFYRKERKLIFALLLILCLFAMTSCSGMSVQTVDFFSMDTFVNSTVITKKAAVGKEANIKIAEICDEIENRISKTIETSEIYKLNNNLMATDITKLSYYISKETSELLETANFMKEKTNGAFNPNLGDIIDLWNVNNKDTDYSPKLPERIDFNSALEKIYNSSYEIKQNSEGYFIESDINIKFDLGGIGKGYAIDKISDYLVEIGIPNALVSFESSILAAGKNRSGNLWTIGVKNPLNPDELCGWISATDKVISVSGGYERFITIDDIDYCHIIDPETGYPVDNDLLCVIVVMYSQSALQPKENSEKLKENGTISDALSTALYVMGKEKALMFYNTSNIDFEMILFVKDDESPKGYDIISTNLIFGEIN